MESIFCNSASLNVSFFLAESSWHCAPCQPWSAPDITEPLNLTSGLKRMEGVQTLSSSQTQAVLRPRQKGMQGLAKEDGILDSDSRNALRLLEGVEGGLLAFLQTTLITSVHPEECTPLFQSS